MEDAAPQHRYLCFSCSKNPNPYPGLKLEQFMVQEDIISMEASGGILLFPMQQHWEEK